MKLPFIELLQISLGQQLQLHFLRTEHIFRAVIVVADIVFLTQTAHISAYEPNMREIKTISFLHL